MTFLKYLAVFLLSCILLGIFAIASCIFGSWLFDKRDEDQPFFKDDDK